MLDVFLNDSVASEIISFDHLMDMDIGTWVISASSCGNWESLCKIIDKECFGYLETTTVPDAIVLFIYYRIRNIFHKYPNDRIVLDKLEWNESSNRFYLLEETFSQWLNLFLGA